MISPPRAASSCRRRSECSRGCPCPPAARGEPEMRLARTQAELHKDRGGAERLSVTGDATAAAPATSSGRARAAAPAATAPPWAWPPAFDEVGEEASRRPRGCGSRPPHRRATITTYSNGASPAVPAGAALQSLPLQPGSGRSRSRSPARGEPEGALALRPCVHERACKLLAEVDRCTRGDPHRRPVAALRAIGHTLRRRTTVRP